MVTRAIEKAQRKVEDYNFEIRKSLLEYDDVMDQQRKTIYAVRQDVLEGRGLRERIEEFTASSIQRTAVAHKGDPEGFGAWFQRAFGIDLDKSAAAVATDKLPNAQPAVEAARANYDAREKAIGDEMMRRVEQYILLNTIDSRWKDHLYAIDALKTGIGLRGYGQQDPKNEYKREGFQLFQKLLGVVEDEVSSLSQRIRVQPEGEAPSAPSRAAATPPRAEPPALPQPAPVDPETAAARARAAERLRAVAKRAAAGEVAPPTPPSAPATPEPTPAPAAPASARPSAPQPPAAGTPVPAAAAFDLKRRLDALAKQKEAQAAAQRPPDVERVDRNDPCPCGSGKKYKKCHGATEGDGD
jgi:preprotein translocase subunit SecA